MLRVIQYIIKVLVNIYGFWIDDRIYWTFGYIPRLYFTAHYYTQSSAHSLVFVAVAW
jgi:hypothetical protein